MIPQRPLLPTLWPHLQIMLTDDGSRTLRDSRLDETYHSGCGALSECLVVYLQNSGMEQRLIDRGTNSSSLDDSATDGVRILEVGFGTGMAWLLTAGLAESYGCKLEYISLEHAMLPVEILQQLQIGQSVDDAIAAGRMSSRYAPARAIEARWLGSSEMQMTQTAPDDHGYHTKSDLQWSVSDRNRLRIVLGDARDYLQQSPLPTLPMDAIYFDAFSPATNPELWDNDCFEKLYQRLKPGGVLVSYCVKGVVRRALEAVGFTVDRMPGPPGGKREVLVAKRPL